MEVSAAGLSFAEVVFTNPLVLSPFGNAIIATVEENNQLFPAHPITVDGAKPDKA